jgi:ABC-2 type transport system permease protein
MSSQIRSELFKLRTARSFIVLIALGVGLTLLGCLAGALFATYSNPSPGDPSPGVDAASNAGVVLYFVLILGVLAITTEFRHGSIASTLLVEPDRRRLLGAKLIAVCIVGGGIALFTVSASLGFAAAFLPGRGFPLGIGGGDAISLIAGMTAAGVLVAALGLGIGALVRRQTAAIVGILIYLFVVEPVLTGVLIKSLNRFSLQGAIAEVTGTTAAGTINGLDNALDQVPGGLVLLGYAVILTLVGAVVMQARDVTD